MVTALKYTELTLEERSLARWNPRYFIFTIIFSRDEKYKVYNNMGRLDLVAVNLAKEIYRVK